MNIYTPSITIPEILSLVKEIPNGYHCRLRTLDQEFFLYISTNGVGKTLAEKLFNYCYSGEHVCLTCGSTNVKFQEFTTGYKEYCSRNCVSKSGKVKLAQDKFWSDPDNIQLRLEKSRTTNLEKYGVTHWCLSADGQKRNSESNTKFYRNKFPFEINGRTKTQYSRAVYHQTRKSYIRFQELIDPTSLKLQGFTVDHIFSISDGFQNSVPINIISHRTNLQMISQSDNSKKNYRSDKTLTDLYENFYESE